MGKQKKKPESNKATKSTKTDKKDTLNKQPLGPVTQPIQQKRKIGDLSLFFKREQSISPATIQQKFSLQHFVRSTSIQLLVLQCPNLKSALDKISKKISTDRNLLYSIVEKFLQGSRHQLWMDKYKPRNLQQCLSQNVGETIKSWLRLFYSYRNAVFQESNSFIDDYFGDHSNNSQFRLIKQHGWKLKGLILKGRQGVGKTTVINATARNMEYEIFHCGNQCNQVKYLKEKNQATQSECFKTKANKNQAQIQRTNKSITSFAMQKQEKEIQTQTKRIQFMHDVGNFHPREDNQKFFNELNKTIASSKIPFIMTLNGENVPLDLKSYDVIEFQQAKVEDISTLLYLIFNVQKALGSYLNLQKIVEKEKFKQTLNQQLGDFSFQILSPYSDFIKLTEIFNRKLDYLFTFIQNAAMMSNRINLEQAEQMMKQYLKRATADNLMSDYFYVQTLNPIQEQTFDSKQSNEIIQVSKYLVQNDYKKLLDSQIPTFVSTPNKEEQISQNNHSRTKTNVKFAQSPSQQNSGKQSRRTLNEVLRQLQIKVIEDYNPSVQNDECFIFNKLYNLSREKSEETLIQNISMQVFIQIQLTPQNNQKTNHPQCKVIVYGTKLMSHVNQGQGTQLYRFLDRFEIQSQQEKGQQGGVEPEEVAQAQLDQLSQDIYVVSEAQLHGKQNLIHLFRPKLFSSCVLYI